MAQQNLLRIIILLILPGLLTACKPVVVGKTESLSIGLPALEQNALIYIAEDQGYFEDHDVTVTIQDFDTGVSSLKALLDHQVELAVAAEFPVVRSVLNQDAVTVIASLDKFENDFVVGRKDRGISQISDLKGKRIGVALHTINEFYLGRLLELNGIHLTEVTLVDVEPAKFVAAIAEGQVDAIIAWQPYIYQIEQQVPDVVIWPAQHNQSVYGLLISRESWLAENEQMADRFFSALMDAEVFLAHNPNQAKTIVQSRLGYEDAYLSTVWPQHQFGLTLDHSLIVAMTDEARWLIKNQRTTQTQTPDFFKFIAPDRLQRLKPEAVDIIRR